MHGLWYVSMYLCMLYVQYVNMKIHCVLLVCMYVLLYVCMLYVCEYENKLCIVCMYVCMYVCIYVLMYYCMYVWMYVCMYVCMHVCMYVCMYYCMYVCMYVCMYICMYVYMYVCMYVCMYNLYFGTIHVFISGIYVIAILMYSILNYCTILPFSRVNYHRLSEKHYSPLSKAMSYSLDDSYEERNISSSPSQVRSHIFTHLNLEIGTR